jgi:hypothetical protein
MLRIHYVLMDLQNLTEGNLRCLFLTSSSTNLTDTDDETTT